MMPIIAEAPALPGVPAFLAALMQDSGESATLALSILRDIVQSRPQDRAPALTVVSDMPASAVPASYSPFVWPAD